MDKQINIKEALDWYIWAGVVETCGDFACIEEQKIDIPAKPQGEKKANAVSGVNHLPVSPAIKNAKDLCEKISSMDELREALINFKGCNLKNTAASTIIGEGKIDADIMFIGEAPGADEDKLGRPFVGKCGKLLDIMLTSINISRDNCYITNILPWRPPGNRTPTDEELSICLPFIRKQIELINPKIIVLLGGVALKSLMETNDPISRSRGKWLEYDTGKGSKINAIATYHPSFLLRNSLQKSKSWTDLLRLSDKVVELDIN